jgi:hypothetical protein
MTSVACDACLQGRSKCICICLTTMCASRRLQKDMKKLVDRRIEGSRQASGSSGEELKVLLYPYMPLREFPVCAYGHERHPAPRTPHPAATFNAAYFACIRIPQTARTKATQTHRGRVRRARKSKLTWCRTPSSALRHGLAAACCAARCVPNASCVLAMLHLCHAFVLLSLVSCLLEAWRLPLYRAHLPD